MPNWLATREQAKRGGNFSGADHDAVIDRLIDAASRQIDRLTRRRFIPETATRLYPWPTVVAGRTCCLWLSHDLLSVTTLQARAQDTTPVTIPAADYFLESQYYGPPYNRIEIDLSSTSDWEAGTGTAQRSISVLGSWGYGNDTAAAGTLAGTITAAATTLVCSNGALIGVGDTLLIGSEQLFVSGRSFAALGTVLLDGALTADKSQTSVTVDAGHGISADEVIQVQSERMFVESVSGNVLTVIRAYDGTTLAAHADNTAVQVTRTLTVIRGVNGTTAAAHSDAAAISKYQPPADVVELCMAEAIAAFHQEQGGWGRTIGMGEGAREFRGAGLGDLRERVVKAYRRARTGVL